MGKGLVARIGALLMALFLAPPLARAESDAGAAASGKAASTLLDPTPDDQLRGMDTDRPNKTNTPHTIDAGHVQVESGFFDWTHDRNREHGGDTSTDMLVLGHVNLRLGVLDRLELNVAVDSLDFLWSKDRRAQQSSRQHGFGDITVGGKLNLWGDEGDDAPGSTAFALQPQLKIPSANPALGNGYPEFFLGAPFLVNLPAGFHLGLESTLASERNHGNSGDVVGWQNSASLDHVLVRDLDAYVEYWLHLSNEHHQQPQQSLDIGFIYPLSDNLALDAGANVGLDRATPMVEILSGLSLRF